MKQTVEEAARDAIHAHYKCNGEYPCGERDYCDIEMNDGVYFDQNGNEVIVINGFEYSREEFASLVDMCGDCNM